MSSFIGFYGKNALLETRIKKLADDPDFVFSNESVFLLASGSPLNTHYFKDENNKGFVACGIGITNNDSPRTMTLKDWRKVVDDPSRFHDLDGHFAIATWNENELSLFTDQLGMRNIFIHRSKEAILFSTRLDWLLSLTSNISINWAKFGSNWLSTNPFSSECFLDGIDRLAQGGTAKLSNAGFSITNKRWSPTTVESDPEIVTESLRNLSLAALKNHPVLSLGLSGGLDSRVLFALLKDLPEKNLQLYTFTKGLHPDEEIARKLSSDFAFKHHFIPLPDLSVDEIISTLDEANQRSLLSNSIFAMEVLSGYTQLGHQKVITLDGAVGEIGRRRFLRGIELKARKEVLSASIDGLIPHFSSLKADIFSQDVISKMTLGFRKEFETEIQAMPSAQDIGIGNWLDILTIRSRSQNTYGTKQDYIDDQLFHYMPFLQPSFLNQILSLPEKNRANASFFRSIISNKAPSLTKTHLVKGDDEYPYFLKDIGAMVWMKTKRKFSLGFKSSQQVTLMLRLEEYVKDLFSSQSIKEYPAYDQKKIHALIDGFYSEKNYSLKTQLDALISFEVFRKNLF